jgi:hypothetical protein
MIPHIRKKSNILLEIGKYKYFLVFYEVFHILLNLYRKKVFALKIRKAEETHVSSAFVLSNAFCAAKSYLNILRKQNISHFAKRNISHLPKGQIFHTAEPYFTENA